MVRSSSFDMGAPIWPPNPPTFDPPRRSRVGSLDRAHFGGPRYGPHTHRRSSRPGEAGALLVNRSGGPDPSLAGEDGLTPLEHGAPALAGVSTLARAQGGGV